MIGRRLLAPLLAALCWALPVAGDELVLPRERRATVLRAIDEACPDCRRTGFVLCGGPKVASGPAFAATALQGSPRRGYLVGFVMTAAEFRNVVRGTRLTPLTEGLERRFARARLVVLEDRFARARLPEQAPRVRVDLPSTLHACVADPARPWGTGGACRTGCCEKALGRPAVTLTWFDLAAGEEIRFEFRHGAGESRLVRTAGGRRVAYSCATDRRYGLD
ncbi:hypothetical protein STVA_54540 [Allostella vacuolata]|nr:hypothetical protein STVA_54540 [Stella vacuolata]